MIVCCPYVVNTTVPMIQNIFHYICSTKNILWCNVRENWGLSGQMAFIMKICSSYNRR